VTQASFDRRVFTRGALVAVTGHVVIFVVTFLIGSLVSSHVGGLLFLGGEALWGLACVIYGSLLFRRGEQERGFGFVVGWFVGVVVITLLVLAGA
jgi:hypothetical protein